MPINKAFKLLFNTLPVLFLVFTSGCESSGIDWSVKQGRVIDEATGEGIPDAIVIARWEGVAAYTNTLCYHVESTTTDEDGYFMFPAWREENPWAGMSGQHIQITSYKAGYEESKKTYTREAQQQGVYYQKVFEGTSDERLEYLLRVSGLVGCGAKDGSKKALIPIMSRLLEDAKTQTSESREKTVESLFYDLEILQLGFDVAGQRHLERVKK